MTAETDRRARAGANIVLFLETNGSGMSSNLREIRDALLRTRPDLELRYLITKPLTGRTKSARQRQMVRTACRAARYIVCASDSLPGRLSPPGAGDRRILVQPVRQHMLGKTAPSFDWTRYTDVFAQSLFVADAIRPMLGSASATKVHATGIPAADRFASPEAISRARRSLLFMAPRAEGRKVITLTTMRKARTLLDDIDLCELAERLSSEYYLVLKTPGTDELLRRYPATLSDFVFDAQNSLVNIEHLLASDILMTTVFADAALFATSRRQLRLLCSRDDAKGLGALLPEAFAGLTLPDIGALPESLALPDGFAISASFADTYAGARDGGATEALLGEVFAP